MRRLFLGVVVLVAVAGLLTFSPGWVDTAAAGKGNDKPGGGGGKPGGGGGGGLVHNPIVFVHGFSSWGGSFGTMKSRFKSDGWTDSELHSINYDSCQSVSNAAQDLKSYINNVLSQTNESKVDIIAHSMGGLVADAANGPYAQFAALGSPFKGTDTAYLCTCASCFDMRPPGPGGCASATWWSPCDEIINPDSSAQCGKSTKTSCISHGALLSNTTVYNQVRNYVEPK